MDPKAPHAPRIIGAPSREREETKQGAGRAAHGEGWGLRRRPVMGAILETARKHGTKRRAMK